MPNAVWQLEGKPTAAVMLSAQSFSRGEGLDEQATHKGTQLFRSTHFSLLPSEGEGALNFKYGGRWPTPFMSPGISACNAVTLANMELIATYWTYSH